jgi:hypothetical protein
MKVIQPSTAERSHAGNLQTVGCAICGSTWGDYWEEIEGDSLFFCCDLCAKEFKSLLHGVREKIGENAEIKEIEIQGDYRGRRVKVRTPQGLARTFLVRFDSSGGIQTLIEEQTEPRI